ncbi:MAG: hypothetical protein ACI9R7_002216 [Lysobacterales bacterium]
MNTETISLMPRVRHRAVGEDGVLVHLDSGRVIVVNEIGNYIVQLLDQPMSRIALVASLIAEFDVTSEQAETDLDLFLGELGNEQLVEHSGQAAS